jgi:hypothetical protein
MWEGFSTFDCFEELLLWSFIWLCFSMALDSRSVGCRCRQFYNLHPYFDLAESAESAPLKKRSRIFFPFFAVARPGPGEALYGAVLQRTFFGPHTHKLEVKFVQLGIRHSLRFIEKCLNLIHKRIWCNCSEKSVVGVARFTNPGHLQKNEPRNIVLFAMVSVRFFALLQNCEPIFANNHVISIVRE